MTRNAWISWGQWLAVVAMTAEHLARFVLPDAWGLAPWATLVGRIAFPLFAAMVAWHAVHNTRDPLGYALRMLAIALIAQLPYALVLDTERLNVVFTLALGLLLTAPMLRIDYPALFVAMFIAVGIGPVADAFEYGPPGLLLVPAFALAFQPAPAHWRPLLAIPAAVIGYHLNPGLVFNLVSLATVLGLLVLLVRFSGHVTARLPAMPRALWLSWYPLHFALIAALTSLPTTA
ncbi:conjugal transfer protein TraX [Halomonas organivorans]